jgi:hypothetical protein
MGYMGDSFRKKLLVPLLAMQMRIHGRFTESIDDNSPHSYVKNYLKNHFMYVNGKSRYVKYLYVLLGEILPIKLCYLWTIL